MENDDYTYSLNDETDFTGPPKIKVLIVGNRFNEGLENITKAIATQANCLVAPTQYTGDFYSYLHYLEASAFRGEIYSVGYGRDKKYKAAEDLFDLIIYISEPNFGTKTYHAEISDVHAINVAKELHYYYLTLASLMGEVNIVHNFDGNRSSVVEQCVDLLTKAWRIQQ